MFFKTPVNFHAQKLFHRIPVFFTAAAIFVAPPILTPLQALGEFPTNPQALLLLLGYILK
jgi:hypothetical protein